MFLEKLSEYADQIDLPPPMYQLTPVRYVIHLDADGNYVDIDELTDEKGKASISLEAPHCKRTSGVKPKLLVDNGEYTLGIGREKSDPRRVQEQHAAYVTLVKECAIATREPTVVAVTQFLDLPNITTPILQKKRDFDPSSNITFQVNGVYPFEQKKVREYWAKKAVVASDSEATMECLVCGNRRPPVERLPIVIKGIPGGQSTGLTLISANASAFESFGLTASLIAPTCEVCGERFGNALNELLRQKSTHFILPPLAFIFWIRRANASAANPEDEDDLDIPDLMEAKPEVVKRLYQAPREGDTPSTYVDAPAFYAATLSASGARVVLRDWIETSLQDVVEHLKRFFWLQRIQLPTGELHCFPLYILINTTINRNSKEKPVAQVGEALIRVALHGGRLPTSLMYRVIHRIRASREVQPEQAALIKMVLLSQQNTLITDYEGDFTMTTLDEENTNVAYLCGRLLAQLDYIQYRALGKVNATIVDRFYGTASIAPAVVFPRLLKGAIPHLAALRPPEQNGQHSSYAASLSYPDREIAKLLEPLTSFPSMLTLEEQGQFALGFFYQRAKYLSRRQGKTGNAEQGSIQDNIDNLFETTKASEEE